LLLAINSEIVTPACAADDASNQKPASRPIQTLRDDDRHPLQPVLTARGVVRRHSLLSWQPVSRETPPPPPFYKTGALTNPRRDLPAIRQATREAEQRQEWQMNGLASWWLSLASAFQQAA
jgi:hypothetical protein